MATFTSEQAKSGFTGGPGVGWHNFLLPVMGWIEVTAAPADGDIYQMCYTPKNFLCVGGYFAADDLDTGGTEALDMDLGWAANGDAATVSKLYEGTEWTNDASSDDPDGLLDMGVLSGDTITDLTTSAANYRPIVLTQPKFFSAPTLIQVECNTAAASFSSGWMTVCLFGKIIG
jgi:hypothetical protein